MKVDYRVTQLGNLRKDFEAHKPKDDIYILRLVEAVSYVVVGVREAFVYLDGIQVMEDKDYLNTHLDEGLVLYESTREFIDSYLVNKDHLEDDLKFLRDDIEYFKKGLVDVLDMFDLKDFLAQTKDSLV